MSKGTKKRDYIKFVDTEDLCKVTGKIAYPTARDAYNGEAYEGGQAYQCEHCRCYHITTKVPKTKAP